MSAARAASSWQALASELDTTVVGSALMQRLTIQQAAETTGWSQRMLRYLEQAGLVAALRTPGGHRLYGPRQIERLQRLRDLLTEHDLGITDIAFELRMRTDAQLARAVDEWFGAIHRPMPPPEAGIYRKLATVEQNYPDAKGGAPKRGASTTQRGDAVGVTLTPD